MLIYQCPTCNDSYPAEIVVGRVIYIKNNQRIDLKNEEQDCINCEDEIAKEARDIKAEARARVRARKKQQT